MIKLHARKPQYEFCGLTVSVLSFTVEILLLLKLLLSVQFCRSTSYLATMMRMLYQSFGQQLATTRRPAWNGVENLR